MYIRKTTKHYKGKSYTNYLLVESVHTPKGPRQRIICSLGALSPGPKEEWHTLASKVKAALEGQLSLKPTDAQTQAIVQKAREALPPKSVATTDLITVNPEQVSVAEPREV